MWYLACLVSIMELLGAVNALVQNASFIAGKNLILRGTRIPDHFLNVSHCNVKQSVLERAKCVYRWQRGHVPGGCGPTRQTWQSGPPRPCCSRQPYLQPLWGSAEAPVLLYRRQQSQQHLIQHMLRGNFTYTVELWIMDYLGPAFCPLKRGDLSWEVKIH